MVIVTFSSSTRLELRIAAQLDSTQIASAFESRAIAIHVQRESGKKIECKEEEKNKAIFANKRRKLSEQR